MFLLGIWNTTNAGTVRLQRERVNHGPPRVFSVTYTHTRESPDPRLRYRLTRITISDNVILIIFSTKRGVKVLYA